jgi:hypothetical protein
MAVMGPNDPRTVNEPPEINAEECDIVRSRMDRRDTWRVERVGPLEVYLSKRFGQVERSVDRRHFDQQFVKA